MRRIRLLDFIVSFLAGVLVGIILAGVLMSPKLHEMDCDDGYSEQVEDGVVYKTYIPALDTCRSKK